MEADPNNSTRKKKKKRTYQKDFNFFFQKIQKAKVSDVIQKQKVILSSDLRRIFKIHASSN